MNLLEIHKVGEYCAVVVSVSLNFLLTWLALTDKSVAIKAYRPLMLMNTFSDLVLTTSAFLNQPVS